MFIKILVTLVVIAAAILMLKRRNASAQQSTEQTSFNLPLPSRTWAMAAAALLLLSGLWGWDRYQAHYQVLEVRVYSQGESEPHRYQVYQGEIDGRRFTTIHGLQVELGAEDRLVIVP